MKRQFVFAKTLKGHWAEKAFQAVYRTGIMSGVTTTKFDPNAPLTRASALITLVNVLGFTSPGDTGILSRYFKDASNIPTWAASGVALDTQAELVVNYPNTQYLEPQAPATRGDVAAFIYQALVNQGQAAKISSPYIVR